jgi:hypothetical protein
MKGQSQVVSVVLIVALGLASLAFVLPWTFSMIQKKQDMKSLDDAYSFFKSLDETIKDVAKNGGEEFLKIEVPGLLSVYPKSVNDPLNNSIIFSFSSKVSNMAEGEWIPLNTPNMNETGAIGLDTPSVIFGKATSSGEDIEIKYRLWFRKLVDVTGRGYIIVLNTTDNTIKSTDSGYMKIQRITSSGEPLTSTEINIVV